MTVTVFHSATETQDQGKAGLAPLSPARPNKPFHNLSSLQQPLTLTCELATVPPTCSSRPGG